MQFLIVILSDIKSEKQHFRNIYISYYRKGQDVLIVNQCQNWFAEFRPGFYNVEGTPCFERLEKGNKGIT